MGNAKRKHEFSLPLLCAHLIERIRFRVVSQNAGLMKVNKTQMAYMFKVNRLEVEKAIWHDTKNIFK